MDAKPIKYLHDKNVGKYKMKMNEKYIVPSLNMDSIG